MGWKHLSWGLAGAVALTLFWTMHVQLNMAPDRSRLEDVQMLLQSVQEQASALSGEVKRSLKRLDEAQERFTAGQGEVLQALKGVDARVEERLARVEERLAALAGNPAGQAGAVGAIAAGTPDRWSSEEIPQDGTCPPGFPHPYKADDLGIPNHCCSTGVNCAGQPINADKDFECCGGEDIGLPMPYRYRPQGPVPDCENFTWWVRLSGLTGPLWPVMKEFQKDAARAADLVAAPGSQHVPRSFWAGKDDSKLAGADATRARQYVGSAWELSGRRQLQTARRFMDLKPDHEFLEVGCGALNAGQFFMHFLDAKRYVCVEPNAVLHQKSMRGSPYIEGNATQKGALFITREDFDPRFGVQPGRHFDRSWSHSVLSHAADWQLMQYLEVMNATLRPETGIGMASIRFSDATGSAEFPTHDTSWIYPSVSYFDFGEARCMARRAGLELTLVPESRVFMTRVVPAEYHDWVRMRHLRPEAPPRRLRA